MPDRDQTAETDTDGGEDVVSQTYEWSETAPSTAVVETVSAATDTEPTELATLQHAIDADALDALVADTPDASAFQVTFQYAGTAILVTGAGSVQVRLD
jgi:hypothetical protein